jgi:hypothetical protein
MVQCILTYQSVGVSISVVIRCVSHILILKTGQKNEQHMESHVRYADWVNNASESVYVRY